MFIVFEGIDGAGKSTQVKLLKDYFASKGLKVFSAKYPSKGFIGSLIKRRFLNTGSASETDSFLFLADMFDQDNILKSELRKGSVVVSDRYFHSFICYQKSQGFNTKLLSDFYNRLVKPDIVFVLKCSPSLCYKRFNKGRRSKFETLNFLQRVSKEYENLSKAVKDKIVMIDASKPVDEVFNKVLMEVGKL